MLKTRLRRKALGVDVVIPTRNDFVHLGKILEVLEGINEIDKVIVVDNASDKVTSQVILNVCKRVKKAKYVYCSEPGKGNAVKKGITYTTGDVLFLDADIENFSDSIVRRLLNAFPGHDLVKASIMRKNGQCNNKSVVEAIRKEYSNLKVQYPMCGIYCARRSLLLSVKISPSWSVDMSILLQAHINAP